MGAFLGYFREHRWQRRALTASLSLAIGGLAALLMFSTVRDHLLIRDLSSDDQAVRDQAMMQLTNLAREYDDTRGRLVDALDTDDDLRFRSAASILRALDAWDVPGRQGLLIDRLGALDMAAGQQGAEETEAVRAMMRQMIVVETLASGRDNRHVRTVASLACADATADVRELGALLAARFGDDETLGRLLGDADPAVASAAALSAAAGRRKGLIGAIGPLLESPAGLDVVSAGAYALAVLDAEGSGARICSMLAASPPAALRDRLLHVMTVLNTNDARKTVSDILATARKAGHYPPAMALLVAGKLKLAGAAQDIRDVLTGKRTGGTLDHGHLQAAIQAATLLDLPVRNEVFRLCRTLWGPDEPLTLIAAVRLLGRQAATDQPHESFASRMQCVSLLRLAAATGRGGQNWPGRGAAKITADPFPAAAAAVELWRLDKKECGKWIRLATRFETLSLPGDYVAWHVGLDGPGQEATTLGFEMLPPLRAGVGAVYDKGERTAGAMLLALAARTDSQRAAAIKRIALRLKHEDDFMTTGAYRCALLILGDRDQFTHVRTLRKMSSFPRRRVITALLAAGDKDTIDWLLLNPRRDVQDTAGLFVTLGLGEVLDRTVATLGQVDLAGDGQMQQWQTRLMRHRWGVGRGGLVVGLRR